MTQNNFTPTNNRQDGGQQSKPLPQPPSISQPKEAEPLPTKNDSVEIQEVVEHEKIDTEVQPHIEVRKEIPKVADDLKKIGVQPTQVTPQFSIYQSLKLPLKEEKIPLGLKASISESFRWLATLAQYIKEQSQAGFGHIHRGFKETWRLFIKREFGR